LSDGGPYAPLHLRGTSLDVFRRPPRGAPPPRCRRLAHPLPFLLPAPGRVLPTRPSLRQEPMPRSISTRRCIASTSPQKIVLGRPTGAASGTTAPTPCRPYMGFPCLGRRQLPPLLRKNSRAGSSGGPAVRPHRATAAPTSLFSFVTGGASSAIHDSFGD